MRSRVITKLSTKGQLILPKPVRDNLGWGPGTQLVVEEGRGGVVVRKAKPFPETRLEDVIGMFHKPGRPTLTMEDMDAAVAAEARKRVRD